MNRVISTKELRSGTDLPYPMSRRQTDDKPTTNRRETDDKLVTSRRTELKIWQYRRGTGPVNVVFMKAFVLTVKA